MPKNPQKTTAPTRKHLARQEREKQQSRWIIIVSIVVLAIVGVLILVGLLSDRLIQPNLTIASINDERIKVKEFQSQARFSRIQLIENASQTYQFMQLFQEDPNTLASFANQLLQINAQLDKNSVGQQVLDRLIADALIRQEASKRGIEVTDEEVAKEFQNLLGYFPEGTPTPQPTEEIIPTSTFTTLQLTAIAPTATPILTATATLEPNATPAITETVTLEPTPTLTLEATNPLTPTATLAPTPSPTPYTEEGYKSEYQRLVEGYTASGIDEASLKYVVRSQLLRDRVQKAVLAETEIPDTRQEVWARHILVADEQAALDAIARLEAGEDWCKVTAELSTDTSNKDQCGDLGWFTEDRMVAPFSDAAFSVPVGEVSDPVQTEFGWHIIWVLGNETRQVPLSEYQQLQSTKFDEWLQSLRDASEVNINDNWQNFSPDQPTLPTEIQQFLIAFQNNQLSPSQNLEPTPEP